MCGPSRPIRRRRRTTGGGPTAQGVHGVGGPRAAAAPAAGGDGRTAPKRAGATAADIAESVRHGACGDGGARTVALERRHCTPAGHEVASRSGTGGAPPRLRQLQPGLGLWSCGPTR